MASPEFYDHKIRERGHDVAAKYAAAARQDQISKMIATGLWCIEYGVVVTPKVVTAVLKAHGKEAALTFARINSSLDWVARKLETGQWRIDYKPHNGIETDHNNGRFERLQPKSLWKREPHPNGKTARAGGRAAIEKRRALNRIERHKLQPKKGSGSVKKEKRGRD